MPFVHIFPSVSFLDKITTYYTRVKLPLDVHYTLGNKLKYQRKEHQSATGRTPAVRI